MNPMHRTLRLLAAGTAAAALAGYPTIASAEPPLATSTADGGPLPIVRAVTVYTNHDPDLARALSVRKGIDIEADLGADGGAIRWRVLIDDSVKFAFMQAAEIEYVKKPTVKFTDLTGDGVPELLIYRKSAAAADGMGLSVYDGANGFKLLFDVTDPSFTIADLPQRYSLQATSEGGVRVSDPSSGLSGVIPDAAAKGAEVEPVSTYEMQSGKIVAVQRVASESDGEHAAIGWLRMTYSYLYGAFVPEVQSLSDAQGKLLAQKSLLDSEGPEAPGDDI